MPMPDVAFPCGSASTNRDLCPQLAITAAKCTAVVVLHTPPFWFATAIILAMYSSRNLTQTHRTGYTLGSRRSFYRLIVSRVPPLLGTRETSSRLSFVGRTRTPTASTARRG